MVSFETVYTNWNWKPIWGCPGRFKLMSDSPTVPITDILGDADVSEHRVPGARDLVLVAAIENGGIISYLRSDGTLLHTLNTPDGFQRKLKQLDIQL